MAKGYMSRMRRAIGEASNEHDGAYKCPMSMGLIADRYRVDFRELVRETERVVRERGGDGDQTREALIRAERKLSAYVGICKDDTELTNTVLPMVRAALEKWGSVGQPD